PLAAGPVDQHPTSGRDGETVYLNHAAPSWCSDAADILGYRKGVAVRLQPFRVEWLGEEGSVTHKEQMSLPPALLDRHEHDIRFHRHDNRSLRGIQRGGIEGAGPGLVRPCDKQVAAPAGKELWECVPGFIAGPVRLADDDSRATRRRYTVT